MCILSSPLSPLCASLSSSVFTFSTSRSPILDLILLCFWAYVFSTPCLCVFVHLWASLSCGPSWVLLDTVIKRIEMQ